MIATVDAPVRKFNPGTLQTDEQVKQQFVVRQAELDIVVEVLRGNVDSPSCQHLMVVAPRGRGKTMLLARLAAELRTDGDLSTRLLPVRFMEESLEVFDIADFWLEAMFQLAQEIVGRAPELAEELRRSRKDLLGRRDTTLAEQAFAAVMDAAAQLDRQLVLMVENMQDLCRDVSEDFGWQLRSVLQTEPQLMLVGTATARFPDVQNADKAFFELFRFLELKPLDTEGCRHLWGAVTGETVTDRAVRPLEILTGGSPRLLVIVAQFARHRSLAELMEELVAVVDAHTEYFRGHLEALAKGERRVYVAVIDLWQPSSTGEVANRARMDVRATSTLLGRLVAKGLVAFEGTGKQRRYVATERLYAIYYKLRRERDEAAIVLNLIRFMAAFYSEREFAGVWDALVREGQESPLVHAGLNRALGDAAVGAAVSASFRSGVEELMRMVQAEQYAETLAMAEQLLPRADNAEAKLGVRLVQSLAYMGLGDTDAVLRLCGDVEDRLGHSADGRTRHYVALAMLYRAFALKDADRPREAVDACRQVIQRFEADRDDGPIAYVMTLAFAHMATALARLGELTAALDACHEAHRMLAPNQAEHLHIPTVYMISLVLGEIALAYLEQGNSEAASSTWRLAVDRYGQTEHAGTQHAVAVALLGQAIVSKDQGAFDAAEALCDDVVARFGHSDAEPLRQDVANALVLKGEIAVNANRAAQGVAIADEIEREFGALSDYAGAGFAWQARRLKATALADLGEHQSAVEALRAACAVFVPMPTTIQAMTRLVVTLVSLGVPALDVLGVLAEDDGRAKPLGPLILALAQECGLEARAPDEALAVAADIRAAWRGTAQSSPDAVAARRWPRIE